MQGFQTIITIKNLKQVIITIINKLAKVITNIKQGNLIQKMQDFQKIISIYVLLIIFNILGYMLMIIFTNNIYNV